jgi:hypothetical protein
MSWLPDWLTRPKPSTPNVPIDEPGRTPWLRVWRLLRDVNLKDLWPVVISVPTIVFFAISGFIAWVYLLLRAVVLFVRKLFR